MKYAFFSLTCLRQLAETSKTSTTLIVMWLCCYFKAYAARSQRGEGCICYKYAAHRNFFCVEQGLCCWKLLMQQFCCIKISQIKVSQAFACDVLVYVLILSTKNLCKIVIIWGDLNLAKGMCCFVTLRSKCDVRRADRRWRWRCGCCSLLP